MGLEENARQLRKSAEREATSKASRDDTDTARRQRDIGGAEAHPENQQAQAQ
jgi:hypothetical protein